MLYWYFGTRVKCSGKDHSVRYVKTSIAIEMQDTLLTSLRQRNASKIQVRTKFLIEMTAVAAEKPPTSLKSSYISAHELNSKGIQIRFAREIIVVISLNLRTCVIW